MMSNTVADGKIWNKIW